MEYIMISIFSVFCFFTIVALIPFFFGRASAYAILPLAFLLFSVAVVSNNIESIMFKTVESKYSVEDTVARIQYHVENSVDGWKVIGVKKPGKAIAKAFPGTKMPKVSLIEVCSPKHAKRIIENYNTRGMSIMMPCTVSVYESVNTNGMPTVMIRSMRAGLMGYLFGRQVYSVMKDVAADQNVFLNIDSGIDVDDLAFVGTDTD
jgi:uncharacterized protein (DUF302 family)